MAGPAVAVVSGAAAGASPGASERREQDLLAVAAEVQNMIESTGWKPIEVTTIGRQLSMPSHMILLKYTIGLLGAIEQFPKLFRVRIVNGCQMVTCCGVPWLGPVGPAGGNGGAGGAGAGNGNQPAPPGPTAKGGGAEAAPCIPCGQLGVAGMPRGKALEMMSELAETPSMQEALREIAVILLQAPGQSLLVSELGSRLSQDSRTVLRTTKIRVAQLLQCFPDDFQLAGTGPGTAVSYRHTEVKRSFMPHPSNAELNNSRFCRLLKLAADVTERYAGVRSISAREVQSQFDACLLVDCRTPEERAVGVLPNSIAAADLCSEDLVRPEFIVAYCCIGACSAWWCQEQLDGLWSYKVRFLVGGVAAWAHQGGTFVDLATLSSTSRVHCWVEELASFFPVPGSGYEVVATGLCDSISPACPTPYEALRSASEMRYMRFQNLALEVRMRYWPSVFCLEAAELQKQCASAMPPRYLLVDCRTPEERQVSTLAVPGMPMISADEFRANVAKLIASYVTVVTFCTIGGRSGIFCKKVVDELVEAGYCTDDPDILRRKVVNLLGGVASWLHSGGGLVTLAGQATRRLHPWCRGFLDMFPIEGIEIVFDEWRPVPQDAVALVACKAASADKQDEAVPQKLLQMCNTLPPEVIKDSLTRAMQNCAGYED